MHRRLLALVVLPWILPAKTPIAHEDVWLMKRLDAPAPSPDGKWVVVGVSQPAYDAKGASSDLWIMPADGSAKPRQITHTKGGESGVSWSPDSTRIAFAAQRDEDEVSQIYVLDISTGGEARRLTSLSGASGGPRFSPDGKTILFQSLVYPGAVDDASNRKLIAERKARKFNARVYDTFPIRNWDKWLDEQQRHILIQPVDGSAPARDLLAGTKVASGIGFSGIPTNSGQELQPVWSPDSQSIVFTATTLRNQAAYAEARTDLYQVRVSGGEPKALTSGPDSYSTASFSPDGKFLLATLERQGEKVYNLDRLVRFDWPSAAKPVLLTGEFDRAVAGVAVSPDSRTVFFTAEDSGLEKLYSVPSDGGSVKTIGELKSGTLANLAGAPRAGKPVLVAVFESAVNPPEVVSLNPATGERKLLTSFNVERAAGLDLQPLRHFWFTSSRGKKIHSMLALPPAFDENKRYPLFVVMHGGPHTMWRDQWVIRWNYHLLARPGYIVLLTNYTGSTGFGEQFAQGIQGDPLAGPAQEINEAADFAAKEFPFIDASRQCAGGASYGGHLANWLQASTTRYKCLISHSGLINLESQWGTSDVIYSRERGMGGPVWEGHKLWQEQNPVRFAAKFKTPILLTVGENDFRVPLNQTLENWAVLQRMKVPSRLIVFPEENHWILRGENSRFWYSQIHAWLENHIGSAKPN